jgi:Flp pilus assembly pilin Flp
MDQDQAPEIVVNPADSGIEARAGEEERGQSLVEYSILLVWTCLAMIAVIHGAGQNVNHIWTTANNDLTQANVGSSQ